ncbi:hypothetical protein C1H46_017501 [Malus baccata]|uniref:Uncharacterized protein n=1 Tax=Malus baccata TaxID=106549 RepID=A0A540MDS1_MALBA|nr:hypothetical protein C1H46_017501 [Malus baccata]
MLREEMMTQADRDTMKKPPVEMSSKSKYFWTSKKEDVVRMRRTRNEGTNGGGSSYIS